ncbi:hypothetical protein BDB01DRAFT_777126 [Pilobolus umbonatus]|nr:hypothetical protein BDB01DRAFT_777126 [Pilobolus umbonatus]
MTKFIKEGVSLEEFHVISRQRWEENEHIISDFEFGVPSSQQGGRVWQHSTPPNQNTTHVRSNGVESSRNGTLHAQISLPSIQKSVRSPQQNMSSRQTSRQPNVFSIDDITPEHIIRPFLNGKISTERVTTNTKNDYSPNRKRWSNQDLTDIDHNLVDNKNELSRSRSRYSSPNNTVNGRTDKLWGKERDREKSNNGVHIEAPSNKFDDVKVNAIGYWKSGIDLVLDKPQKPKPKIDWLSRDTFFEDAVESEEETEESATVDDNLLNCKEESSADNQSLPESPQENKPPVRAVNDRKAPAWLPDDEMNQQRYDPNYGMTPVLFNHMLPIIPPANQRFIMAPPYMHIQAPVKKDTDILHLSYAVVHNLKSQRSLNVFQKKMEDILMSVYELSDRTFCEVLNALNTVMNYEISSNTHISAKKIMNYWKPFIFRLHAFMQNYMKLPEDLITILHFMTHLMKLYPQLAKELQINKLPEHFNNIKVLCLPQIERQIIKLLEGLQMYTGKHRNITTSPYPSHIPDLPTGELIFLEVVQDINPVNNYEKRKEVQLCNKVHNPWPNVNISDYILVHFMLLREELIHPVRNVLKKVLKNSPTENSPGTYVYKHIKPIETSLTFFTSEVSILFELDRNQKYQNIMSEFKEGSLIYLYPESDYQASPSDEDSAIYRSSKNVMIGQANGGFSWKQDTAIVSVHILNNELDRLDWSAKYIAICVNINAPSMLTTLNWLRSETIHLNRNKISDFLAPRLLAAANTLNDSQMHAWYGEPGDEAERINKKTVPDYLDDAEIDLSCIIHRNMSYKFSTRENNWPRYFSQWDVVTPIKSHGKRQLYNVSPSQLKAIQFVLNHRIAVIAGPSGTGKTYLAGKLAVLLSDALRGNQCHRPVLVVTKSQAALDTIMCEVSSRIQDFIRFGGRIWDDKLRDRRATKLSMINETDINSRQYNKIERDIVYSQLKMKALTTLRHQVEHKTAHVLCNAVPPDYLAVLQDKYNRHYGKTYNPDNLKIWEGWLNRWSTKKETEQSRHFTELQEAIAKLEYIIKVNSGSGIMPILDPDIYLARQKNSSRPPFIVNPLNQCERWPFDTSKNTGNNLRRDIGSAWNTVACNKIWQISDKESDKLIQAVADVIIEYIDSEMATLLKEHEELAKSMNDILVNNIAYISRFNRVIGMTADIASANREWLSKLWPHTVIVDEASEILESVIASVALGSQTEHLVLLGSTDSKPVVLTEHLKGDPHNLDVSLFERWKGSGNEMISLEEQWRLHPEISSVVNGFDNLCKQKMSSMLITASLATCAENMVKDRDVPKEMYGIKNHAFYIDYTSKFERHSTSLDMSIKSYLKVDCTDAEVNEARFVSHLAVYLSQQPYQKTSIAILTLSPVQKLLIKRVLKTEVPSRTIFNANVPKINVDMVDDFDGRENWFVILSTATPGKSVSNIDKVLFSLSRATNGLYIIGKPLIDQVHQHYVDLAHYMKDRGMYSSSIELTCHTHGDKVMVADWKNFSQVKNGGCSRPCNTLMPDGHVCPEQCHFMSHEYIECQEPCNRLRPTKCTHACPNKCFVCSKAGKCLPCEEITSETLPCGHAITGICHQIHSRPTNSKCTESVTIKLTCGHEATVQCYQAQHPEKIKCTVFESVELGCGHTAETRCGIEPTCAQICSKTLTCGHSCNQMCGILHSHSRDNCQASCPKKLICGHGCAEGCVKPDEHTEACQEDCNYICSHGYKCSRKCWKECIRCVSDCPFSCEHLRCTKKCYEICDRPPCDFACKKILDCRHPCAGLCGEPCPPCVKCKGDIRCSISLKTLSEFDEDEKAYMLPECGCVFSLESLDAYFKAKPMSGEHTAIKLWCCPTCQQTIYTAPRYSTYIKMEIALVNKIKAQMERKVLTYHEKNQIINAMNEEIKHGNNNIVGGRWFVCQNRHPYYVGDCGGATEISKCPDCNAEIGGLQHRVIESNRFYGEFDGSDKPAWPGQPNTH